MLAVSLSESWTAEMVKLRLGEQLPPGLELVEVWAAPGYKKKETFGEVDLADYLVTVQDSPPAADLQSRLLELLARAEIKVERGGEQPEREVDLRPMIVSVKIEERGPGEVELRMRLQTGSHGGAKPLEVVALLGIDAAQSQVRMHRMGVYAGAEAPASAPPRTPKRGWGRARWVK
jgi:radical SAM-linked protein